MSFSITPSDLIQYLYCPRFTYYERVLRIPQNEEKYHKVMRGRELHLHRARTNVDYLRRRIGATSKELDRYLTNDLLRGEVDEVLSLADGTMAPLDYKFARWEERVYSTYRTQLLCYAWLIEENYGLPVRRGFLVYTRSKNKLVEVEITSTDLERVRAAARRIYEIISTGLLPKATRVKKRCVSCTYRNVCPH